MTARSRVLSAVLLIGAMGWLAAGAGTPLYDGLGFPDEPYRYVQAPPGAPPAPPATGATQRVPAADGINREVELVTDEQGPQLVLYIPPGAVHTPPSATSVTVTATPLAADAHSAGGEIDGNVYRLTIDSNTGPVSSIDAYTGSQLTLRATSAQQVPSEGVYRSTAHAPWSPVPIGRAGTDIYAVEIRGAGDYALALLPSSPSPTEAGTSPTGPIATAGPPTITNATSKSGSSGGTARSLLFIAGGFIVMVLVIAVLTRRAARSAVHRATPRPGPRRPTRRRNR